MSINTPNEWVVVKIKEPDTGETIYKVFGGWWGGYGASDSWKMNSGIVKAVKSDYTHERIEKHPEWVIVDFHGYSGSIYRVNSAFYRSEEHTSELQSH